MMNVRITFFWNVMRYDAMWSGRWIGWKNFCCEDGGIKFLCKTGMYMQNCSTTYQKAKLSVM